MKRYYIDIRHLLQILALTYSMYVHTRNQHVENRPAKVVDAVHRVFGCVKNHQIEVEIRIEKVMKWV